MRKEGLQGGRIIAMVYRDRPTLHPHEEAVIRRFVSRDRRGQWLRWAADARTRISMLGELCHFHDFAPGVAQRIRPSDHKAGTIYQFLKERGAPDECYALSIEEDLDGKTLDLHTALEMTVGRAGGTILSCIPGQLAYFEGEEHGER